MAITEQTIETVDSLPKDRVGRLYARFQDRMLQPQGVWRARSVLDDPDAADKPFLTRHALAVTRILTEMPIEIVDDELIVGMPAVNGVIHKIVAPEFATLAEKEAAGMDIQLGLSHKTPSYPDVITRGLSGIMAEIDENAARVAAQALSAKRDETLQLYEAMKMECRAVIALSHRYADLAERMAAEAPTPERAAELRKVAAICRYVPEFPARTFHEALQCTWMVHYALFSAKTKISLSRLDQYCGPLLEKELAAGTITTDEARELVGCLWVKFNDRDQILRDNFEDDSPPHPWRVGTRTRLMYAFDRGDAVNHWGQNILLSGITPEGKDGTNAMTYLCLDCMERLQTTSPVTAVRLHKDSPPELVRRCAEVLKTGGAMPLIFNDDAIVPAYIKLGVTTEDARDYGDSNCWETMIAGKSDQELIRGGNFLLMLEWALNRGVTLSTGARDGIDTGDPREFQTFDDLMDAWKRQADAYLAGQIDFFGKDYFTCQLRHSSHGPKAYNPLLSALVKDCITNGADVIRGGARYVIWHVMAEACANATDAMSAIKKFVYDDRTVTMDALLDALHKNWEGFEPLRQSMISRAPKFANDNPEADGIGKEMLSHYIAASQREGARYPGIIFSPCVGTFSWYQSIGKEVSASCDGRFDGEPITSNFSPTFGMDRSGPTAVIRSYSQMCMDDLSGGGPCDLRFAGSELRGEAGTERLAAYINAFVRMGGNMMTLTVTDAAVLRAALKEPMKYRGLRVRMGGWSAYWIALGPEQQRVHLRKVEHGLA